MKDFVDDLKLPFDIIAVSETWADSSIAYDYSTSE